MVGSDVGMAVVDGVTAIDSVVNPLRGSTPDMNASDVLLDVGTELVVSFNVVGSGRTEESESPLPVLSSVAWMLIDDGLKPEGAERAPEIVGFTVPFKF